MIDPGQMRTRLVYEAEVEDGTYDEHGDPRSAWTPQFELWARVRPLKGSESDQADQVRGTRFHEITCRWRPGIEYAGQLRIKGTDRILNIESIVDWEERRRELTITATERVFEG